jgi:hypothetical protein
LILLLLLAGYFLCAAGYVRKSGKKERIGGEKKGSWYQVFGAGIFLILSAGRKCFRWRIRGERLEVMKKIYLGKSEQEIFYAYYTRAGCLLTAVVFSCLLLALVSGLAVQEGQLLNGYFLKREDVLGQEKAVALSASLDGEEKNVTVSVPNMQYSDEELEEKFAQAKDYINRNYLGENSTAEQISEPLCLVATIPDSAVTVEWQLGADGLISEDGSIANEELEESCQTEITAVLQYGEQTESVVKQLTVLPRQKTREEQYWDNWQRQLEHNQESSLTGQYLKLPQQVEGKTVHYSEKTISAVTALPLVALFGMVAVIVMQEERLRRELTQRQKELRADYPEFVEHFVLLIGAGLNVKGAWERIAGDYRQTKRQEKKQYVYEEMLISVYEMENGMSEARAYELFGKRTGLLQYMKFCTLIVQNLKKGSDDLLHILEYEVADAFRERKESAKALGEEAGTKLLLPMMLMLVIVFVLILYAAFYNM